MGTGLGEGGGNRHPIPHVVGLWPKFTPSSSASAGPHRGGAAVAVPGPSSSPTPDTLDNSHFPGGLFTSLCASVQVLPPLDHWPSFLCQGGRGGEGVGGVAVPPPAPRGCKNLVHISAERPRSRCLQGSLLQSPCGSLTSAGLIPFLPPWLGCGDSRGQRSSPQARPHTWPLASRRWGFGQKLSFLLRLSLVSLLAAGTQLLLRP